uniref:Uncharacterized protein n=1 Tax=Lepeophtheirus salmonis TaxID=72036 RepID=A0A0K2VE04_LEPSM
MLHPWHVRQIDQTLELLALQNKPPLLFRDLETQMESNLPHAIAGSRVPRRRGFTAMPSKLLSPSNPLDPPRARITAAT